MWKLSDVAPIGMENKCRREKNSINGSTVNLREREKELCFIRRFVSNKKYDTFLSDKRGYNSII